MDKPASLILISGESATLRLIQLEWVGSDLPATFRKAVQQYGNTLFDELRLAVVIVGTELQQYKPEVFKWLCGVGPNPQDPNWMGQLTFTPRSTFEQEWPLPPAPKGKTSRQMVEAPKGAIFVWCNERLDYPINLALHLEFDSQRIRIVRPSWLEHVENVAQCRKDLIVLDHACQLTPRQQEMFDLWKKNRDS